MVRPKELAGFQVQRSGGTASSQLVIVAGVNPHRLGFAGADEPALFVEFGGLAVRNENLLVKSIVPRHQHAHELPANATALVIGMNDEMRVVDDEVPVGDGIGEADERVAVPCGDERMAIGHGALKGFGFLGRGPADGLIEADELIDGDVPAVAVFDGGRCHRL